MNGRSISKMDKIYAEQRFGNPRKSKYGNRKTEIMGEKFDSRKEADRWLVLRDMEQRGMIHDLRRQVKFVLIPAQREVSTDGNNRLTPLIERELSYIADFVYFPTGEKNPIVEDVKGKKTDLYIAKRKMMLWFHGIRIKEV